MLRLCREYERVDFIDAFKRRDKSHAVFVLSYHSICFRERRIIDCGSFSTDTAEKYLFHSAGKVMNLFYSNNQAVVIVL